MPTHAFTIRKLSDASGVGIEAIRYYQRRGLLAEPVRVEGGFRAYSAMDVRRLRFIKRAQELGYSLDDAAELMTLSRDSDRSRVRALTDARVAEIRERIAHLEAIAHALADMTNQCGRSDAVDECPIIAALTPPVDPSGAGKTLKGSSRRTRAATTAAA